MSQLTRARTAVEDFKDVYNSDVVASKDSGEWSGLSVQLHHLKPTEQAFPARADVEISMHVHGRIRAQWIGEGFTEECDHSIGDICIAPPQLEDWWGWNEHSYMLSACIHSDLIASYLGDELNVDPARVELKRRFGIRDIELRRFCTSLLQELERPRPGSALYVADLTWQAVAHLSQNHAYLIGKNEPLAEVLSRRSMDRVVEYLRANLARDHSLEELAEVADMTPRRFTRAFKLRMRMTPYEFVIAERVTLAAALLRNGRLSDTEVAERVGLDSTRHLAEMVSRSPGRPLH